MKRFLSNGKNARVYYFNFQEKISYNFWKFPPYAGMQCLRLKKINTRKLKKKKYDNTNRLQILNAAHKSLIPYSIQNLTKK